VLAALAVILYIQHHPDVLAMTLADNQVYHELQGLKGLATATDQQAGIVAGYVNDRTSHVGIVGGSEGLVDRNSCLLEELSYHINRQPRSTGALINLGNPDSGQLGPYAQESGFPPT
jgi:hypothetical protein